MNSLSKTILMVLAATAGISAATPVDAQISVELAKKCRALMVKAHPTKLYGPTGTEAAQRTYFQKCISKKGNMPESEHGAGGASPGNKD